MKAMISTLIVCLFISTSLMARYAYNNQSPLNIKTVVNEIASNASEVPHVAASLNALNENRVQNLRDGITDGRLQNISNAAVVGSAVIILDKDQRVFVLDPNENKPSFSSSLSAMAHVFFSEVQDSAK